ncbi:MAG TPA: dihydrolipoamide acetyltransferase family protein [bacterium]|nr:dihydrolipoamide acetyltransferase family protein [bacterium]
MIKEIIMPKLGETMEEGYINRWLKKEGDRVKKGEVILEVMSDKTNFEVESQYDGYLRKILVQPSENPIPVTTIIGYISDSPDEEIPTILQVSPSTNKPQIDIPVEKQESVVYEEKQRIKASPAAKKLANELGINIENIKGSGESGRIEKKDVEAYIAQGKNDSISDFPVSLSPMRKIIAERLKFSKQNIPHYYLSIKILMDAIVSLKNIARQKGKNFTYTDFIIFYTAKIIQNFPLLNASFINDQLHYGQSVDIGLAVDTKDGLVVPVLRDIQTKNLDEISAMRIYLVEKARNNQLKSQDIENCRFVITNLGMYGVRQFQAIINPPATSIMAIGSIEKEPVIVTGKIVIGQTMWISLSLDHRVIDGAYGGQFLQQLKQTFENPGVLNI